MQEQTEAHSREHTLDRPCTSDSHFRRRVRLAATGGWLAWGQTWDSGFGPSFVSMAACLRTASLDYSSRFAPCRIKSEALLG